MLTSFRITTAILMLIIASFGAHGQKAGLNSVSRERIISHMTFLASDEMQGRETGTAMNDAAALYIMSNLMRMGAGPVPGKNSWFQDVPMKRISSKSSVSSPEFESDSVVSLVPSISSAEITAEVVFAGFGYENKATGYSDLEGLDITGKIVIIMTGTPESLQKGEGRESAFPRETQQQLGTVLMRKPGAMLIVYNGESKFSEPYTSGLADMVSGSSVRTADAKPMGLPLQVAFITRHIADMLLKPSGQTINSLTAAIKGSGKPSSFQVEGPKATAKTSVINDEFNMKNVIGIIEGSDPVLKNECIVFTAHFDHTGMHDGKIFNGADDNASGSVALLEIAEAFTHLKKKPRRTIVFAWVNGEEKGLIGSRYYVENPVFPLDKTLLNINLDMVGRSKMPSDTGNIFGMPLDITDVNELQFFWKKESSELGKMINETASEAGLRLTDMGTDLEWGGSDHMSFWSKGIPAVFFHSAVHADLHREGDDVEKIDFEKMEKTVRMCYLLAYRIANNREKFRLDDPGTNK